MVYAEFLKTIQHMLKQRLGDSYSLRLLSVSKNNGILLDGLTILTSDSSLAPTVYLNSFYEQYQHGMPLEDILDEIQVLFENNPPPACILDGHISDFSRISPKVMMKLIHTQSNKLLLADVPHMSFMDLSVVFYLALGQSAHGQMTALIHNEHMNLWKTDEKTLLKLATANTPAAYPPLLQDMGQVMRELAGSNPYISYDEAALNVLLERTRKLTPLYVLTNSAGIYGACCVLYPGIIKDFAKTLDSDLVIIPSSIHEVLLTPVGETIPYKTLNSMVASINESDVPPEDRLSDHIYLYRRKTGDFHMILPSGTVV